MYPVRLGYSTAVKRIKKLMSNGHHAEALVTAVFTTEKTFYRVLKKLVISAGFPATQADVVLGAFRGFENVKKAWECFDPKHKRLTVFLSNKQLQTISEAQTMRNRLVHGQSVYKLSKCRDTAERMLVVLEDVRKTFKKRYGFDGWNRIKLREKSYLHSNPMVKTR
jgi:hypothetical protein